METKQKIELKDVLELLPKTTSLVYVDYRDNLDGHHDIIQECIHKNNFDALYEAIDEWYRDAEWDGMWEYINGLRSDLESKFGLENDKIEEILEDYQDEIRDEIYNRCDDDILKDLLKNTSDIIAHYDTGHYVEEGSWNWSDAEIRLERMKIKKVLQIENSTYDSDLDMMIRQASYGGNLLVYFIIDVEDFINVKDDIKSIQFTDAWIGIVDNYNGSGDICQLKGHSFILPYNRENLFLEEAVKYNWTYDIAGMSYDWCYSTNYALETLEVGKIERSVINNYLDREKEYNETFRKGKCTFGDMDFSRHRNKEYINNYPCGNKCKDCGTFWID